MNILISLTNRDLSMVATGLLRIEGILAVGLRSYPSTEVPVSFSPAGFMIKVSESDILSYLKKSRA